MSLITPIQTSQSRDVEYLSILARYQTSAVHRPETSFCASHMKSHSFNLVTFFFFLDAAAVENSFQMIPEPVWLYSIQWPDGFSSTWELKAHTHSQWTYTMTTRFSGNNKYQVNQVMWLLKPGLQSCDKVFASFLIFLYICHTSDSHHKLILILHKDNMSKCNM